MNDTQNSDNWIQNSLDQINANRGVYNQVNQSNGQFNISTLIGRFGQNTHTLADFSAHTNWVDAASRGGKVCNELKSPFSTNLGTPPPTTTEEGYVPYGLNKTTLWDEQSDMANLYTGTVSLSTDVVACNGKTDIGCTADKTTHGYWNKDHEAAHTDDPAIAVEYAKELANQGLFAWKVDTFNENKKPADVLDFDNPNNNNGILGLDYFTDTGLPPTQGERIYVRSLITNYHYIALQLAIQHTTQEIQTLYDKAAGVMVGTKTLQEVFAMSKSELNTNKVGYIYTPAMNQGVQDEQKS